MGFLSQTRYKSYVPTEWTMEEYQPDHPSRMGPHRREAIVCHGDSLTWGFMINREESYPARLERHLGGDWQVFNTGQNGDTAEGGLTRLSREVLPKNPRLVVIGFGTNDFYDGVPSKRVFSAMDEMVERVVADGAEVILWGFPLSKAYGQGYEFIARKHKVPLLDYLHADIYGRQGNVFPDGIHLTAAGYAAVEARVLPVVLRILGIDA